MLMYYNRITSHEDKVAYLESLRTTVRATSTVAPVTTVTVTPELTEELRTFRDSLAPETLMYYNCITSHEGKVAYLESLRATFNNMQANHEIMSNGLMFFISLEG
uniref:Uncharacterized protein n=1 Tax=Rhizophagus irregularis (strain DAOM 181602 / DAOM 197198 / MUCL 43194) TaxID=747089 RepID=U9T4X8_RHIID